MKDAIEAAVEAIAKKVTKDTGHGHDEAYTQAVLNLTHALATLDNLKGK